MYKIAIIVPYFGRLPQFYKAWEKTALANDTIDFYLFTDDSSARTQKNIFVKKTSFAEFKATIQEKFEFEISLTTPYKLCDYKPTYGLVFEDLLKEYDWWGYCDVDLLLGNIRGFFNDTVLSQYDRCQLLGHLCIYRNNETMKTLFKAREDSCHALNYDVVYRTDESLYFDEARGMYTKCLLNRISNFREESFRDPLEGERKFYQRNGYPENNYVIFWEDGHVYCVEKDGKKTELLYAHFYRRKFVVEQCDRMVQSIKIMPGRVKFNSEVTGDDFAASEPRFYKILYKIGNAYKSFKRYGIRRSIARQQWSKEHDKYIDNLVRELKQLNS